MRGASLLFYQDPEGKEAVASRLSQYGRVLEGLHWGPALLRSVSRLLVLIKARYTSALIF